MLSYRSLSSLPPRLQDQVRSLSITTFVCVCAIVLVAFVVKLCRDKSAIFAAISISVFNALFPAFAQAMTNIESHSDEGHKQRSLYVKIALFRWVTTAIVIQIITVSLSTFVLHSLGYVLSYYGRLNIHLLCLSCDILPLLSALYDNTKRRTK